MSNNKLSAEIADALKSAPRLRACLACWGEGSQRSLDEEEVARNISDDCYACSCTGFVSEEQYQDQRLGALVSRFAAASVRLDVELSECASEEEGGWDYQLAAAENMMSVRDYLTECAWAREAEVASILECLSPAVLADVLAVWS
jgi:hypothetical protein